MTISQNWSVDLPPLVVPAGGKSERMKTPKGLLNFFGKPWLKHQLDCYRRAGGKTAVVVLGFKADDYLNALSFLKVDQTIRTDGLDITTLLNPLPQFGPFSTIQMGLSFLLRQNFSSFAFLALDRPAPRPAVWHRLANILNDQNADMVFPVRNGKDGHPVMLSGSFAQTITTLNPETGRMDKLRLTLPDGACLAVEETDINVGFNLNTPEQWREFLNQRGAV